MILGENTVIQSLMIHRVGNKGLEEGTHFSQNPVPLNDELQAILRGYFLSSFKSPEYCQFYGDEELTDNDMYNFVDAIFEDPSSLPEQSINIARHLYENSVHPKIKHGEVYVVLFENCCVESEEVTAIGVFKSENRETFLKVFPDGDTFSVEQHEGIDIHKLDKGCVIFCRERERGYQIANLDNLSKGSDGVYWKDSFLKVRQREDAFFKTEQVMKIYKEFVTEQLPQEYETSTANQADMLNRSMKFFKEQEAFTFEDFEKEVIVQPEVIQSFNNFKEEYQKENIVEIPDEFNISEDAVKKTARTMKSVIKLDKNFHIYIHGSQDYINKGYDEKTGMHFYQLFFRDEII
jgi:hypothetical protein